MEVARASWVDEKREKRDDDDDDDDDDEALRMATRPKVDLAGPRNGRNGVKAMVVGCFSSTRFLENVVHVRSKPSDYICTSV